MKLYVHRGEVYAKEKELKRTPSRISHRATEILDEVEFQKGDSRTLHDYICALVQGICDYSDFYVSVVRYTGQNDFRRSIYQPLRECVCELITTKYKDEITEEMVNAIDIYLFGCIGYMEHHLLANNIVPADKTISVIATG